MSFDYLSADRQPDSRARDFASVQPVEDLKNLLSVAAVETHAVVLYRDGPVITVVLTGSYAHMRKAARLSVLYRISYEILKYLRSSRS